MSTPLMKQYAQVKAKYPDTILLFRMGDFFETFEEDAKTTAKVLGITLTKRGNGAAGEIPLAGFPHHALESYLPKLLRAGHRVAVCEQLEDPKLAKGIVRRDVIEVVTPGIAFSDKVLEQKQNNFLAAVALPSAVATGDEVVGFAFVDVSTGEFNTSEFPLRQLAEQVATIGPVEILVQKRDAVPVQSLLKQSFTGLFSKMEDWIFHYDYAYELLIGHFSTHSLKGFGVEEMRQGVVAAGVVMNYLQETQKANLLHIKRLVPYGVGDHIVLDPATKRNLEITSTIDGSGQGTLFSILDRTCTAMGGRLLKRWINQPLNAIAPIIRRLDAVEELACAPSLRKGVVEVLSQIGDLERMNTRICTGRANPRDMVGLKNILKEVERLKASLAPVTSLALVEARDGLQVLQETVSTIERAIEPEPPLSITEGGVIRVGYSEELDSFRSLAFNGKKWIADLQKKERERTGISSLKIGFNNVFGYYIEITNTHSEKIPTDYIRKQTLTNAERYITPDLKEYEEKILHAEEKHPGTGDTALQ